MYNMYNKGVHVLFEFLLINSITISNLKSYLHSPIFTIYTQFYVQSITNNNSLYNKFRSSDLIH